MDLVAGETHEEGTRHDKEEKGEEKDDPEVDRVVGKEEEAEGDVGSWIEADVAFTQWDQNENQGH